MKKIVLLLAVVSCISLAGCGQKETSTNLDKDNEVVANQENVIVKEESQSTEEAVEELKKNASEQYEEIQNRLEDIAVSSDSNTISFSLAEGQKAVYHHDGSKITGYEVIIQYNTEEEAVLAKNTGEFTEEDDVESVTVKGSTLVVKFKPEAYEDTTLEDVQQSVSLINSLKGN